MNLGNFAQRALVALVGIPIVVFITLERPLALLALLFILGILCAMEFYGLAKAKGFLAQENLGMGLTGMVILAFGPFTLNGYIFGGETSRFTTLPLLEIVLALSLILVLAIEMFRKLPNPYNHIAITLAGIFYIGIGLGSFYGIREYFHVRSVAPPSPTIIEPGLFLVIMLASIWICDTAAYFGGKTMGKNKLFERISPNKTWEGAAWGLVFAIGTWFAARALFADQLSGISAVDAIMLGLIVGVVGQMGDLAESLLKRDAGVKDSSNLIPGHGGVLDRLDSILFVSPLTFLYLYVAGV